MNFLQHFPSASVLPEGGILGIGSFLQDSKKNVPFSPAVSVNAKKFSY